MQILTSRTISWVTATLAVAVGCSNTAAPSVAGDAGSADLGAPLDTGPALRPINTDAGQFEQPLVQGLRATGVALFQSVKVTLSDANGTVALEDRSAPVVANRTTVVRVYVAPEAGWVPQSVTAQIILRNEGEAPFNLALTRYVSTASSDANPTSVFTFDVPRERVRIGTRLAVQLLAPTGRAAPEGRDNPARLPADGGTLDLDVQPNPGTLRVTLVPYIYNTDTSGRLPDTSDLQLQRYRGILTAMYPIEDVTFTVHAPLTWARPLLSNGSFDFTTMLNELRNVRRTDGADDDVYYYGLVRPSDEFQSYCRRGCVLGQGFVSGQDDVSRRVAGGLGFPGESSAGTLAHELGHLHGRLHAPCGATGTDFAYPHENGALGVWGYDARRRFFFPPGLFDFMSYCSPEWISDYNYRAIYERVTSVNMPTAQRIVRPDAVTETRSARLLRWGDGPLRLDPSPLTLGRDEALSGERRGLRWLDLSGAEIGRGEAVVERLGEEGSAQAVLPTIPAEARGLALDAGPWGPAQTLRF